MQCDGAGAPRLVLRSPGWGDYLFVGLTEIVHYGAGSPQVARSLRAVLHDLGDRLPVGRRAAVDARIALLDEAVAAGYPGPPARSLALDADRQGLGASGT